MKTWKAKHTELLGYYQKSQAYSALRADLLAQALNGRLRFLFRCSKFYTDEYDMVYRAAEGQVIVISSTSRPGAPEMNVFDSLEKFYEFMNAMSNLPHNVEMRGKIAEAMKNAAAA